MLLATCHMLVPGFRQALLTLVCLLPSFAGLTRLQYGHTRRGHAARQVPIVWVQAGSAVLIMSIFWVWHYRVQPYHAAFQNQLDSWLFFLSIL